MKNLTVPEKHQLKIAKQTLRLSKIGAQILGGMDHAKAKEIIIKLKGVKSYERIQHALRKQ